MKPTDIITFFTLFLSIFASIFSVITFVKELHIEEHIAHLHKHNLNITSIVRLDKDIAHLFETFGMTKARSDRLRLLLLINANATSNTTKGERGPPTTTHRVFHRNITSEIPTPTTRKSLNASTEKD